jgi:hypothetical protein
MMSPLKVALLLEAVMALHCAGQQGWATVHSGEVPAQIQSENVHSGNASLRISSTAVPGSASIVAQDLNALDLAGKRARLSWFSLHNGSTAVVRYRMVASDGSVRRGESRASGNLCRTKAITSCEWNEEAVVLDIPEQTVGLTVELTAENPGWVAFDDFALRTVGADYVEPCRAVDGGCVKGVIAPTRQPPTGQPTTEEREAVIGRYAVSPRQFVNAGFEDQTRGR